MEIIWHCMPKTSLSASESLTTENYVLRNKVQVRTLAGVHYRHETSLSMVIRHLLHLAGKNFIITVDMRPNELTWRSRAATIRTCLKFLEIEDNFLCWEMLNPTQGKEVLSFIQRDNKNSTVSQRTNTEQRQFLPLGLGIKGHIFPITVLQNDSSGVPAPTRATPSAVLTELLAAMHGEPVHCSVFIFSSIF